MDMKIVSVEKAEAVNFILGQSHFIKTVEDIQEAIANINPGIKYGLAFAEASGPCLIRHAGTDPDLTEQAVRNLQRIAAGHSFIILLGNAFPINILPAIKQLPEVCRIYCATANPTEVIVGIGEKGNAILGVIDGCSPKGVETEADQQARHGLLRTIGYKF